jgi:hypothetical protein
VLFSVQFYYIDGYLLYAPALHPEYNLSRVTSIRYVLESQERVPFMLSLNTGVIAGYPSGLQASYALTCHPQEYSKRSTSIYVTAGHVEFLPSSCRLPRL